MLFRSIGNAFGTAPGFSIVHKQCLIIVFPGVPKEMTKMLESEGIKRIEAHLKDIPKPPLIRTYKCFGEGESSLFEKIKDLYPLPESVEISFQSSVSEVIIKIKSEQDNKNDSAIFDALCQVIKEKLGSTLFVEGDETFIGMFSKQVAQSELTLGVAESCTGGLVSEMITDVPGASAFFTGAVVAYDNAVKQSLLTVPKTIIDTHGAVSAACAEAMAEGIRRTLGSDIGCSVTGIAGPTGASPDKPVGTVYFGYADKEQT